MKLPVQIAQRRFCDLKKLSPIIAIVFVWIAMIALVKPLGNFPLIDDANYAESAFILLRSGRFYIAECSNSISIAPVLIGAGICAVSGCSYTVLRIVSICFGIVGIVATYLILREMRASRIISTLLTATLAVNPVYFVLSCTFMTDIPFFAFEAVSIYFFVRGFKTPKLALVMFTVGTVISIIGALTRQFGVAVPLAFTVTYLLCYGLSFRAAVISVLPSAAVFISLALYQAWATAFNVLPKNYASIQYAVADVAALGIVRLLMFETKRFMDTWCCLGLFLLPGLVASGRMLMISRRQRNLLVAVSVLVTIPFAVKHMCVPYSNDLLSWKSIGLMSLRDCWVIRQPFAYGTSSIFVVSMAFGGLFLIWCGLNFKRQLQFTKNFVRCKSPVTTFAALLLFFYSLPLALWQQHCERYYLPLIIPALILLANACRVGYAALPKWRATNLIIAYAMVIAYGAFCVATTHDYMAWNTERWVLLHELDKIKVAPDDIDGGYEFNFLHFYFDNKHSCWEHESVRKPKYAITFQAIPGYHEIERRNYATWMPTSFRQVLLLLKDQSAN